jgi:hypothetical protein
VVLSWALGLVLATFAAAGATVYVGMPWAIPVAVLSFLFVAASVVTAVQRDLFGLTRARARRRP